VIFEITSKGTADEDVENKRELYERLGVSEYFLFDPLYDYLDQQIMGFRLVDGKYEPLVLKDGGLLSVELGMHLVPEGELLALFDARTGKRVPAPDDLGPLLKEAEQNARASREELIQAQEETRLAKERLRQAKEQTRQAEQRERQAKEQTHQAEQRERQAEQREHLEKQRAEQMAEQARQERKRAEELEQEIARLQAMLPPTDGPKPESRP
jgi:hypothetical protein